MEEIGLNYKKVLHYVSKYSMTYSDPMVLCKKKGKVGDVC